MSAIGAPAAAAIQAATSVATNAATNVTNLAIADKNNKANRELAQQQNDWNLEQWHRENAYNDPAAQAQRLRGAGLSAAAAASSVSGNTASPLQSADLANQVAPAPITEPTGLNLIQIARELQALRKDTADADSSEEDAKHREAFLLNHIDVMRWTARNMQQQFQFGLKEFPYKLESLKASTNLSKVKAQSEGWAMAQMRANVQLLRQQFNFLNVWNEKQLDKVSEEIKVIQKEGKKVDAETSNINQSTANLKEAKEGIKEENKQKHLQNVFTSNGMPETVAARCAALISSGEMSVDQFKSFMEQTKLNLKRSNREFEGDIDLKNFYNYIINKGNAGAYNQGLWNFNTLMSPADWLRGHLHKALE